MYDNSNNQELSDGEAILNAIATPTDLGGTAEATGYDIPQVDPGGGGGTVTIMEIAPGGTPIETGSSEVAPNIAIVNDSGKKGTGWLWAAVAVGAVMIAQKSGVLGTVKRKKNALVPLLLIGGAGAALYVYMKGKGGDTDTVPPVAPPAVPVDTGSGTGPVGGGGEVPPIVEWGVEYVRDPKAVENLNNLSTRWPQYAGKYPSMSNEDLNALWLYYSIYVATGHSITSGFFANAQLYEYIKTMNSKYSLNLPI